MARKPKPVDPLMELLVAAKPEILVKLIVDISKERPAVHRACFDYLKKYVQLVGVRGITLVACIGKKEITC